MPRTARLVVPDTPHHVIQRGNRRQDVFFERADSLYYLSLLRDKCEAAGTRILAYCLMPNHVHLVLTPNSLDGLRCIGEVHKCYTRYINRRMEWQGYLWQGRFGSYPMDDRYTYEVLRYVELNPVRAGICAHPADYRWSSARQRLPGKGEGDLPVAPVPGGMIDDWEAYWQEGLAKDEMRDLLEQNEKSVRPLGDILAVASVAASGTQ